jgi:LytR cell envelope-related transcriptional attenuator
VTVKNGTPRQGLAARATTSLDRLGFKASNGGNATRSAKTTLFHAPGSDAAARVAARAVKVAGGAGVARAPQAGLGGGSVVLVLGSDFKGLAARVAVPKPSPPKLTAATRSLPSWDPRPC